MRLDIYITENGFFESRKKASDSIKSGIIAVDGKVITKPSYDVSDKPSITFIGETLKYVGRGGLKLEKALEVFCIDVSGLVCADIGSSTGGFTDCLLQKGAKHVYAIDSGKDQLHPTLREKPEVTCIESFNAKNLDDKITNGKVDIVVMDVSFISQTALYQNVASILKKDGIFISLIKPQFEVGREKVGKNGIVRDKEAVNDCISVIKEKSACFGLEIQDIILSPIKGGDGNTEYLAYFRFMKGENE